MKGSRAALILVCLFVVAALVAPLWYWDRGLVEIEALQFIRQYLDGRSLLQKVFDPRSNDLGTYQARELSYFFDYLDARLFGLSLAGDRPILVPASAFLASLLTVVVFFLGARRCSALTPTTAALLLLVYLTNYVHVVTMGIFYRSTKPLLAPVLMGTAFYLLALLGGRARGAGGPPGGGKWAPLVVFLLFCVMSLLDRQGFFYALVGLAILLVHAAVAGGRRDVAVAGAAAVAAMILYNLVLAPLIVQRVNAYSPSFAYQKLPVASLLTDSSYWQHAAELLLQAGAVLVGGRPYWLWGSLLGLLLVWAFRTRVGADPRVGPMSAPTGSETGVLTRSRSWTRGTIGLVCGLAALAQVVMFAAMIARHPPIYDYHDHRLWYYPLPFQALVVAVLVALLSRVVSGWSGKRMVLINLLLAAAAVSNVAQWNDYRRFQLGSRWFPVVYHQSNALKLSLKDGRPRPFLNPDYSAFYQYCLTLSPALRAKAERR